MAEGHVQIDADDWGRIEVALTAIPKIQEDLASLKLRLDIPVARACQECPDMKTKVQVLWEDRLRVIGWLAGAVAAGGMFGGIVAWIVR